MSDVYRVMTRRLRVQRGSGRPDLVVERPFKVLNEGKLNERVTFGDSDTEPTLVKFDEHCQVNVDFLLRTGAIVPYTPPKAMKEPAGE